MKKLLVGVCTAIFLGHACADEVQVAVAANFATPLEEIAKDFNKATGHQLKISSGASGKFYSQIKNGAPFQVFLSADQEKPEQLEKDGYAVQGTRFTYAVGKLALWSANPDAIDSQGKVLEKGRFNKLALANPKVAPYGEAAIEALNALKLKEKLEPKFVFGENIGQTYTFVASGNAEIGFVALSQITQNNKVKAGSAWIVPEKLYSPIKQDAVLLVAGKDSAAARQFLSYLKSDSALRIIKSFGYGIK